LEKERKRNSKIQITSCKFFNEQSQETTVLQSGKRFVIKLQAKFNIDAKEVAFGVMFRNGNDKDLFGFHSLYSENPLQIEEIKAGTEVEIIFDGQMLLNRGLYNIYIGIADNVKYPKFDLLYSEETGVYIEVTCSDILWGSIMNKYNTIYNKLK
jgi:hypothetical protein